MAGENLNVRAPSQTLLRGLDIIDVVADAPLTINEIAQRTGMTYSTTHRILMALQQRHFIQRDQDKYRLGRKLMELGYRAYSQVNLTQLAQPILRRLAKKTSDTVHLCYADADNVIYLDKVASQRAIEIRSHIGGMNPIIVTAVGKALILDKTVEYWEQLYHRQCHLLNPQPDLYDWLRMMHQYVQGDYALDLGEVDVELRCVAAPVRDSTGQIVAAISVASLLKTMPDERRLELIELVQSAAAEISCELGHSR